MTAASGPAADDHPRALTARHAVPRIRRELPPNGSFEIMRLTRRTGW